MLYLAGLLSRQYRRVDGGLAPLMGGGRAMELALFGVPAALVIVALVELLKGQGLPTRYAAPVALGLGVSFGVIAKIASTNPEFAGWAEAVLVGVLAGLSASGLYSGSRAVRGL